jgi:hypothetical protein
MKATDLPFRSLQTPLAAFYGVAGEIVRLIEPHSEADPVALLAQILTAFGSCAGRSAHFKVEGDCHYTNINTVLVGQTSRGRKGTSWSQTKRLFDAVDENWTANRIQHGLSTGEGLIWAVRDGGIEHSAVDDKRLLIVESEFGKVLKVCTRQGNTLSPVVRQAWDSGDLRILTRSNPAKASEAHISIIGHITLQELRRNLTETEVANGFANRFLWSEVRRSKCLPEGGQLDLNSFNSCISLLREALTHAASMGEVKRSDAARELWRRIYPDLSAGAYGLSGAVISRAEAQTMRLALLYALLDQSETIRVDHLRAALALWRYCETSARNIFGESTGDKKADTVVKALKHVGREGMTKTDISNFFKRNLSGEQIDSALRLLEEQGRTKTHSEQTGGRTAIRYFLTECYDYEKDEINEESSCADYPRIVTERMRQRLRQCGETDDEINNMTPREAAALIEYYDGYPC